MKSWIAILGLLSTILWTAPTNYADGTPIPNSVLPSIVYRVFVNGSEFAQVKGKLSWEGTLPQQPGEVKSYTATAEIDGQPTTRSEFTKEYIFAWYIPLNPPGGFTIQLTQ